MTVEVAERVRAELGLDRAWFVQLLDWLRDLARFDLGRSLVTGEPVVEELRVQLGYSVLLAGTAVLLSTLMAVPTGLFAGLRAGTLADYLSLVFSAVLRVGASWVST